MNGYFWKQNETSAQSRENTENDSVITFQRLALQTELFVY